MGTFFLVFDSLRNADVLILGQMDQKTTCQRNLRRQTRTFAVDGVFDDLHHHCLTLKQHVFNALGFGGVLALF